MDVRNGKLIVGSAGGTAGHGSKTYKVSLPSSWVQKMRLGEDDRNIELSFDGDQIVIRRNTTAAEFAERKLALNHDLYKLHFYDADKLCTTIYADFTDKTVCAENHTANLSKTAFAKCQVITWDDFMGFLEERCVPRARAGLREYLEALGLDEYDPWTIIQKTSGRMAEDSQWIEVVSCR